MKRFLTISLGALAFFATSCLDRVAGSTSTGNTGKGTISGRVVGADGQGVANARVTVVRVDNDPGPGGSGSIDAIAVSESDGTFRTDSLPDGKYNLLDAKGGQVALVDSVAVASDSGSLAGDARLGAPGGISGVVRLRPGDDSRTVFLILIGTTTFAVAKDSIGNFVLPGLAAGEYRLRALSTLDEYAPLDTLIKVAEGRETVLPDTLRLAYHSASGLPLIDTPALAYDSGLLSVRVSWPSQDPARVAAYHVYRRAADSGFVRITPAPVKDTFFVDGWDRGFRPGGTYDYAVAALDSRGNEGLKGLASPLFAQVPFAYDTVLTEANCAYWPCPSDIDPSGALWVLSDTSVLKVTRSSVVPKWAMTREGRLSVGRPLGLGADDSGGLYIFSDVYSKLVKYDTLGSPQWEYALPGLHMDMDDCFYVKGDTLIVWSRFDQILVKISRQGVLLSQDTVGFKPGPVTGPEVLFFDPEVGVVGVNETMEIFPLDLAGKPVDHWSPTPHGVLRDFAVDERGRWYLLWDDRRIEVFSPERKLLRTIGVPENVYRIKSRHGMLYAEVTVYNYLIRLRL